MFYRILLATSAIFLGFSLNSASKAADLGGDCCADLEERVAELETTTARKGNKKVSLKLSGFVSKSILIWDDGDETNAYVVDTNGATLASNFTLSGSATIDPKTSAGFQITVELGGADAAAVSQFDDNGSSTGNISLLVASWWISHDDLGKISVGKQSQASDNAALLPDLSGTIIQANYVYSFHGGAFTARLKGINGNAGISHSLGNWSNFAECATSGSVGFGIALDCNGAVLNNVRYDSPTIAGFTLAASWGEDDFWDVALSYAGEFGDFKVKAAYAYTQMSDERYILGGGGGGLPGELDVDFHQVGGSVLHVPTGLFVYGAYVTEDVNDCVGSCDYTDSGWYAKAGIQQNWTGLGKTVLYGEYGEVEVNRRFGTPLLVGGVPTKEIGFADFTRYGAGVVQYIDAAALQLHAVWKHNEVDKPFPAATLEFEDLNMFLVGGTIFF